MNEIPTVEQMHKIARTLTQKWMLEIVNYIALRERVHFNQIKRELGINSRTLTERLTILEEFAIVQSTIEASARHGQYSLTAKGRDLLPVLVSLKVWADRYLFCNEGQL